MENFLKLYLISSQTLEMVAKLKIGAVYRCSGFYNSSSIQVPSYKYGLGSSGDCHVIFVMIKSDIFS